MNILERLLDYELSQSMRHRRYLSLVILFFEDCHEQMDVLLRPGLRRSDAVYFSGDMAVVLMGATPKSEAIKAVNRYGNEFDGRLNIRCSVSSFPDDGKTAGELFNISRRRMKKAMQLEYGAIVAQ